MPATIRDRLRVVAQASAPSPAGKQSYRAPYPESADAACPASGIGCETRPAKPLVCLRYRVLVTLTFAGSWIAIALVVPVLPAHGQVLIRELKVDGNKRLTESAIMAASGLRVGADVAPAELDSTARRLIDTGLFTAVNYTTQPSAVDASSGYSVTLVVKEEIARLPVVLDIPGVDSERLWTELVGSSLLDRVIPSQKAADAYYVRELESFLSREGRPEHLAIQDETDLSTHRSVAVVQPVNRPLVSDLRFEGNKAVSTRAIRERILKLTVGNAFSERDFRRILDLNVRPMFEKKGLLDVRFREVRTSSSGAGKIVVTTTIDEGQISRRRS